MKAFVVWFEPKGYYAKTQPHYEWSLTKDLHKALAYTTQEAAEKRLKHGIDLARAKSDFDFKKDVMYGVTSGRVEEISIDITVLSSKTTLDTVEPPKQKLVCDALMKAILERIDDAVNKNQFSTTLHSLSDWGSGVRGIDMYLSPPIYTELCNTLKKEMGLGVKVEQVGGRSLHKIYWSKFNLAQG